MSNRFTRSFRVGAAAAALTLVAACGGGGSSDTTGLTGLENFSVTATGAVAGTFKGYSSQSIGAGQYRIGLATADAKFALVLLRTGGRVSTGTIQISTSATTTTGFYAALTNNQAVYSGTSGTVTISASSATEVKGTFDITMTPAVGTVTTHLTGSFTSPCAGSC